jgi:hypothetical protein
MRFYVFCSQDSDVYDNNFPAINQFSYGGYFVVCSDKGNETRRKCEIFKKFV